MKCKTFALWLWGAWLVSTALAADPGLPATPPQRGFERNVGQLAPDVLYALDQTLLLKTRVQLVRGLSLEFVQANAASTVAGIDPLQFPLNLYYGPDRANWYENVAHFRTVKYTQIYTGIDVAFNIGDPQSTPGFRITVAPGANLRALAIRLSTDTPLSWNVFPTSVVVWSANFYTLDKVKAYQGTGASTVPVTVQFQQVDDSSFRITAASYDSTQPLVIEFGNAFNSYLSAVQVALGEDRSVITSGYSGYGLPLREFVARVKADGTPAYLTLFDNALPNWLAGDSLGNVSVAGPSGPPLFDGGQTPNRSSPPVTADAPRPEPRGGLGDSWLARFDPAGKVQSATYAGGVIQTVAFEPGGAVFVATADSIVRWRPGENRFGFTAAIPKVLALAVRDGNLAFAATGEPGRVVTRLATGDSYLGPWTIYAGVLDGSSGVLKMGDYVPIIGADTTGFQPRLALALSPSGNLWIASDLAFYPWGEAHTLVVVTGDGRRILRAESLNSYTPMITFDGQGNAWLAATTFARNLPTGSGTLPCTDGVALYLTKRAADGAWIDSFYVDVSGTVQAILAPGLVSVLEGQRLHVVDVAAPRPAGVGCLISPATRTKLVSLTSGEWVTIVGRAVGPPEAAFAPANGPLPLKLGEVEVRVNQTPVPLISVQSSSITFLMPQGTPSGAAHVEVTWRGVQTGAVDSYVEATPRFAVFSADGSGQGVAAAVNQDGSANASRPAPLGSVVAFYGIGNSAPTSVTVEYRRATIEYAGPAPGLPPGVWQVNIRLPLDIRPSQGADLARLAVVPALVNYNVAPVYLRIAP